jgi:hypothetical protein
LVRKVFAAAKYSTVKKLRLFIRLRLLSSLFCSIASVMVEEVNFLKSGAAVGVLGACVGVLANSRWDKEKSRKGNYSNASFSKTHRPYRRRCLT